MRPRRTRPRARQFINIDSARSARLVNQKQFYVSLSRARYDARIYTNSAERLHGAVERQPRKQTALEAIEPARRVSYGTIISSLLRDGWKPRPTPSPQPSPQQQQAPRPSRPRGFAFRFSLGP